MATPIRIRPRLPHLLRPADRAQHQAQQSGKRQYDGALTSRLTGSWSAYRTSANKELEGSLSTLRNRCRDRERNDSWFAHLLAATVTQVVGPQAPKLQSKAVTPRAKPAQRVRSLIESAWNEWADAATTCRKTLWQAVSMLFRSMLRDGDAFAIMRIKDGRLALQILEADFCDETYTTDLSNGNRIVQGVELDPDGMPIAYWFFRSHPGENIPGQRVRVDARDVLHLANFERIGQVRGAPLLSSALLRLHTLSKYEEAELESARNQACSGVYFVKQSPEGWAGEPVEGDTGAIGVMTEPAMGIELPYGVTPQVYNPTHPHGNFPPFVQQQLRAVAAAGGIPYHTLSGDMTSVNYSSARIAYLEAQEQWMCWQELIRTQICEPLFARWCDVETASNRITLTRSEIRRHTWVFHRWKWVDPVKDAMGAGLLLANRLASPQEIMASAGRDPDEVLAEWQVWSEMLAMRGVTGGPDTTATQMDEAEFAGVIPATATDSDDADGELDPAVAEDTEDMV